MTSDCETLDTSTLPMSVELLEEKYETALLALQSARRGLAVYRRGVRVWTAGLVINALALVGSVVAGLVGDWGSATVLVPVGLVSTVASMVGLHCWATSHRIKWEGARPSKYLDPQLNVDMAEIAYAKALRKLTLADGG